MSAWIKTLKDVLGNQILPRTVARAVKTEGGESVENVLAGLGGKVDGITPGSLGVWTKEEVLAAATRAAYGLGVAAVPDEVLGVLSRFQGGLGNEWVWRKDKNNSTPIYTNTAVVLIVSNSAYYTSVDIQYADSFKISVSGSIELVNPKTLTVKTSSTPAALGVLKGKVFRRPAVGGSGIGGDFAKTVYAIGGNTDPYYYSGVPGIQMDGCKRITGVDLNVVPFGYVNSLIPSAYPPSPVDEYTYTSVGQLGEKARLATGSYVGTGTFGAANKNQITFPFEPKILLCCNNALSLRWATAGTTSNAGWANSFLWFDPNESVPMLTSMPSACMFEKIGNSLSWYSNDAATQLNLNNVKYTYVAIG